MSPNLLSMFLTITVLAEASSGVEIQTWSKSARLLIFSKSPPTERGIICWGSPTGAASPCCQIHKNTHSLMGCGSSSGSDPDRAVTSDLCESQKVAGRWLLQRRPGFGAVPQPCVIMNANILQWFSCSLLYICAFVAALLRGSGALIHH